MLQNFEGTINACRSYSDCADKKTSKSSCLERLALYPGVPELKSQTEPHRSCRSTDPADAFDKLEARVGWTDALSTVESSTDLIEEVLPLVKLSTQWTQVLSPRTQVTTSTSLAHLATRSLRSAVTQLELRVRDYSGGSASVHSFAVKAKPFHSVCYKVC